MYRTPRNLKKLNVIDEGWRLLDFKNRKVGEFIEKGYRTARRHTGANITITQNIVDFDSDKASSAARAAWGNSSYKRPVRHGVTPPTKLSSNRVR
ncbi:hypothetical protein EA206_25900, partial [Escherichia coli]